MNSARHSRRIAVIPAALILLLGMPLVSFLLPASSDLLTESYEPTKTLKFISARGASMHKWGPMPAFVLTPVYGPILVVDKLRGSLGKPSNEYPYGFKDPQRQIGTLLAAARLVTLLIGVASVLYLTVSLQNLTSSVLAPVVSVIGCLATSVVFLEPLADTKPDGLMVAFLIVALAFYARAILDKPSLKSVLGLAFFFVASISCKELTAAAFVLPVAVLGVSAIVRWLWDRHDYEQLRWVSLFAVSCAGFYALFNVIYAPATWVKRIEYVFGPLKDANIWASSQQGLSGYLASCMTASIDALGIGGVAVFIAAIAATIARPSYRLALLWLPFVSQLLLTVLTAGYMPDYFMLPLGPLLCLPSAYAFAVVLRDRKYFIDVPRIAVAVACFFFVAGAALCGLSGVTLFRNSHATRLVEVWVRDHLRSGSSVYPVTLYTRRPQSDRLSLEGYRVDDRPLAAIIKSPFESRPEYAFVSTELLQWLNDLHSRPARVAFLRSDSGFDYSSFRSMEATAGYQLEGRSTPEIPLWCVPWLVMGRSHFQLSAVLVYRRVSQGTVTKSD